ncbi:tetratricopeptide repeat protein [Ramlibacter ginsenosidimutans]|uniref:Tetratricopeptide repeat protein n=1 Tax=Ramlibacter ginsenosidimutans TaxID=502333 RepID=A0A934TWA6_9BURK|nr:tetratricopeptide repeat protein [Ramlibacter ginsenosidimutans]MBK6008667.1 tetratricopeptide repeat protein [Ramlibacter ginsenosidimutans]
MRDVLSLSVYNPTSLSDEDFLGGFVARREMAGRLIDELASTPPRGTAKNHLVLGQRGMGKTSMLRRLAVAATSDPRLSSVLIPLSFREEQYNVHSLYVFWVNCLDALGDYFERTGQGRKAEQLDREVEALNGASGASLELFNKWIERENRRPLLLLDNIDLLFAGLKKDIHALREHVTKPGGIVIVGGAAAAVEEITDPAGSFFGRFEVWQLDRLSKEELIACLRRLALARGREGEKVLQLLDKDPARIRTLHDLTGGNPRTLTLMYILLELDSGGDVFTDLERLLDQVTVLYKARVEDLPGQARVVLDAVALAWNPVLASQVAATTMLEVTAVSSQLDRLQKEGVIEKVSISSTTKAAYQISERFFNIWYLMRHGPRRQRSKLRWLTFFLRSFYTNEQLVEQAKEVVSSGTELGADGGQYLLALSDAIDDEGWRSVLKSHARDEFEKYAVSLGRTLDEIVDPSDVPRPQTVFEWIRYGNLLRQHLKRSKEAEAAFVAALSKDPTNYAALFNLGNTRLVDLGDPLGAVDALTRAVDCKPRDLPSHYFLADALAKIGRTDEAKNEYATCLQLNSRFHLAHMALGDLLTGEGKFAEAEEQYRLAGTLAPKTDTQNLHSSAFFLGYIVEQFDRAVRLYKRLLDIDPNDFVAQSNMLVLPFFCAQSALEFGPEEAILSQHPPYGQALIRVLQAMGRGERAAAMSLVASVFDRSDEQIFETYRGFMLLLLREAARQNWGDILLRLMDETGAADRQWPLRAAYHAYLAGEQILLDVNPEVRSAATKILSWLHGPLKYHESVMSVPAPR